MIKVIKEKRGEMTVNEMLSLILVLIVVIVFIVFLYRDPIFNMLKNLPGYNTDQTDKDRDIGNQDVVVKGDCYGNPIPKINSPEGNVLTKTLSGKQYISFNGVQSNLYWAADEKEGEIILDKSGRNLKVGSVKDGIVKIDENLLDPDYIEYQKARINSFHGIENGINSYLINYLIKLDGARYVQNDLCKTEEQMSKELTIKNGWPESVNLITLNELKPVIVRENLFQSFYNTYIDNQKRKIKIVLPNYIDLKKGEIEQVYLIKRNDFLIIRPDNSGFLDIGIIFPDGSIWFEDGFVPDLFRNSLDKEIFLRKDYNLAYFSSYKFNLNYPRKLSGVADGDYHYYTESNLRILKEDYAILKQDFK